MIGLARRTWVTGTVLLLAVVVGSAQESKTKTAPGWNEKDDYPPLFPALDLKKGETLDAATSKLPAIVVLEADPPVVRAAKKMIVARLDQIDIIQQRMQVGQFTGASAHRVLADALADVTAAADLIWDKPEQLLPWYEWRVLAAKSAEGFIAPRVKEGLETDPSQLPQLVAERYKAEIALQKLKEKAKK